MALTQNNKSGYASSSNTLSTGAQGSEHSATYSDPGDCATNTNVYPIGTLIYVVVGADTCPFAPNPPHFPSSHRERPLPPAPPFHNVKNHSSPKIKMKKGLQKYFSVQDVCEACSSESQPHFDLWMGVPSYGDKTQLGVCAGAITVSDATAAVIIHPNDGYDVDSTPLMSGTGTCDPNADYSRTQPSGATSDESPTTLATVVSPSASVSRGGSGHCGWKGHCRGAACRSDDDCADPFFCVNSVCS